MGRPRKTESEKKETSKARFQRYKVKHVNIGKEINRWIHLKGIVGTDSDETLAQFLMDRLMYANADIAAAAQSNVPTEKARMRTEASDKRRSNRGDLYEQLSHTDIVEMFGSNRDVVGERKAICMHTDLLDLANLKIRRICSKKFCNKMVNVSAKYIGTAIQLIWNCSNNHHAYTWNSQPQFNNTPAVDLMLPSISDADYLAVKLTFRRIGIELVSSTTTSEKGQNTTETMYNDFTFVKKESECPNMNSESPQEYPLVGIENIKTEVQTEGTSVEDDNSNDRILGSEEIKIEVMDEEETDTASETATDEEFTEVLDFLNKAKHVKKILVTGDNVTEDCGVRSSRIKERGYRPDYVGLDWNDEMETPEELKSEEPKGVKKNKDAKYSKKDLDFQISDSDYDESDESDESDR